ncbi:MULTISPECIES: RnfABCDGE type electron transport complex subunit B [Legionella]|uniref:Electron transport complex protein n=1 Tax=Legionella drozanskii LLAP-1 TaxID=1212489 RepID=A0A0W0SXR9_9GAMM|nr:MULTISPECIES: RnfABCDGE type electron transport complex subunit B [Legionella]KTC88100.1 electron transport complex protein [Legionella drozanskii LLAP-1]PJE08143.1 MAG: [Fe-S]-binding protein [Legionella sp.]
MTSVKAIDALLPQTQCGECGYAGCLPYAEAMAQAKAPIDRCPPGGVATVKALAELLAIDAQPYLATAETNTRTPALALIRESECIGCTKCIQACPVDAIIGSGKRMHSILSTECTGCGLCVEPCPVDCIEMITIPEALYDKELARQRYNARQTRLVREEQDKQQTYREKRRLAAKSADAIVDTKAKQNYILEALARVQAKKK